VEVKEWWVRVKVIISLIGIKVEGIVLIIDGIVDKLIEGIGGFIIGYRERIYEDGGIMEIDGIGEKEDGVGK